MESSPDPAPFEQPAASRYALGAQIARGGMGSILEAHDTWLSRSVAVKRMLTENEMDSDRSRFQREALVLARLAHPNIVPIHDFGVDERGTPFYAMKLVRGQTLESILRALREPKSRTEKSPYTLERLLTIFQKICDAMAFAHRQGIIHRDLKPDNIMVGEFGEVQVMDWGLAKDLHGTLPAVSSEPRNSSAGADLVLGDTLSGDIMGSPQYMAPEQAEGRVADQDETTDVFLLGGILYAILTLRPPLQGSNFKELLNKAITADIVSPTRLTTIRSGGKAAAAQSPAPGNGDRFTHCPGGRIPPALSAVAMKALSGRKKNRYAAVSDLAAEVEAYQNGFATRAENASAFRLISLFVSRHRAFATSLVLVLAVGGILGTKAFIEGVRAEKALTELRQTAPALRELAESEATFQRFDSAQAKLDAALALAPEDPEGWWQRAWILVGMEKWAEAAAALRVAGEKDTSHPERTAILPTLEELATEPEDRRWTKARIDSLVPFLDGTPNTAPARIALANKLKLAAEPRRAMVADRLEKWLGKGQGIGRAGVVTKSRVRVNLERLGLADLEPLRGLPIDELNVGEIRRQPGDVTSNRIKSLEPLRGMRLSSLVIIGSEVTDLSPLAGMPIEYLNISGLNVSDLSPLRGAPIQVIYATEIQASDFTPLRGAPIVEAFFGGCPYLTNVDFLAESSVEKLEVMGTPITNLSGLRGKSLRSLAINGALQLRDLESLRGSLVREINMDFTRITDYTPLLDLPNLERIRLPPPLYRALPLSLHPTLKYIAESQFGPMRPAAEVWKELDAKAASSKPSPAN